MSATTRTRQPKGVPVGGQFATEARSEATGVALAPPAAETVFTKRYDTLDEKVQAFHDELEQQVSALADDENWQHYLNTMSRFHHYSMYNQLLIYLQRPDATRVAGYRKWEELDRHVMKGQKGISIFAPKMVRIPVEDADGKPVKGPDGKPLKRKRVVGFTTATVFDVSQTDGEPLPEIDDELSETPPDGFTDDLEAAITEAGFTVSYEPTGSAADGYTSRQGKRVVVDPALSPGRRAEVLAHELGHIKAGHLDELDDYHTGHGGQRGRMELEAEAVAYAVCRANGMSTEVGKVASQYVDGWTRKDPELIKESATKVSTTVKGILSAGTWRNMAEAGT